MTVDLNGPNYAATASPIHRAVWDSAMPLELFAAPSEGQKSAEADAAMRASLEVLRSRRAAGTLYEADGRLSADLLQGDLARAGYWGLLIPPQYGGSGATLLRYAGFLTQVAALESSVANLLSVHSCLGPAGVVRNFGSEKQMQRWLPLLSRGERLGVFALTEPHAGSDLSAVATQAALVDGKYRVSGNKVFITNLAPGRVAALVVRIDGKPAVLIAQLPDEETPAVTFVDYGIHAARRSGNRGMRLREFEVRRDDLVMPTRGDGLTIAYHGLNQGRMSLCAVAAGTLRRILAALLPWVRSRRTYGEALGSRELVQRRIGRLASLIVGCDALAAWCASLLDQGYRGELECMVAKIFAAEALKEAAIEIGLRTFGGRTFLHGNLIGDSLHDLLAPCIYEGESQLLGLALMRGLAKGQLEAGAASLSAGEGTISQRAEAAGAGSVGDVGQARERLWRVGDALRELFARHGAGYLDEQCELADLAAEVRRQVTLLCTAMHVRAPAEPLTRQAGEALVASLGRQSQSGRAEEEVGRAVLAGGWTALADVPSDPVGNNLVG